MTLKPAVLVLLVAACASAACSHSGAEPRRPSVAEVKRLGKQPSADDAARAAYGSPVRLAVLEDSDVKESSGVVASRLAPGLFWTHNDSGDGPFIYAFDRQGKRRGAWRVAGARSRDWEDIAAGPGPVRGRSYLYIGDIGDNERAREELVVYRVPEPEVSSDGGAGAGAGKKREASATEPAEAIRLKYPEGRHDAEALLVHPQSGDVYILTKNVGGASGVYRARAPHSSSAVKTLERVGDLRVPGIFGGLLTGGDISPDGRRVVLCDYIRAYELSLPDAAAAAGAFDEVWKQTPMAIDLGEREQGEAVCYGADGSAVFATSERRPVPLIEVRRSG